MNNDRFILQRCCYVGCRRQYLMDLDADLPSVEALEEAWRTGKKLPLDEQFVDFAVYECEGRIYCTSDYLCPWHDEKCKSKMLLGGELCPEHFERFRGADFESSYRNIANADPELFDRRRAELTKG